MLVVHPAPFVARYKACSTVRSCASSSLTKVMVAGVTDTPGARPLTAMVSGFWSVTPGGPIDSVTLPLVSPASMVIVGRGLSVV